MAFKMRGTSMNGKSKFITKRGKLTDPFRVSSSFKSDEDESGGLDDFLYGEKETEFEKLNKNQTKKRKKLFGKKNKNKFDIEALSIQEQENIKRKEEQGTGLSDAGGQSEIKYDDQGRAYTTSKARESDIRYQEEIRKKNLETYGTETPFSPSGAYVGFGKDDAREFEFDPVATDFASGDIRHTLDLFSDEGRKEAMDFYNKYNNKKTREENPQAYQYANSLAQYFERNVGSKKRGFKSPESLRRTHNLENVDGKTVSQDDTTWDDLPRRYVDVQQGAVKDPNVAINFTGEMTNLKNPDKYKNKERKIVYDANTGTYTEQVKRLSGAGWKDTGRVITEEQIQANKSSRNTNYLMEQDEA